MVYELAESYRSYTAVCSQCAAAVCWKCDQHVVLRGYWGQRWLTREGYTRQHYLATSLLMTCNNHSQGNAFAIDDLACCSGNAGDQKGDTSAMGIPPTHATADADASAPENNSESATRLTSPNFQASAFPQLQCVAKASATADEHASRNAGVKADASCRAYAHSAWLPLIAVSPIAVPQLATLPANACMHDPSSHGQSRRQ